MADIRFIYAPIGGGKTLFSVMEICKELERSERFIVTNIPLILADPPAGYNTVQEWCQEWIKRPIKVSERLVVLTKEQALEHWRYLPAEGLSSDEIAAHRLEIIENRFEHGVHRVAKLPLRPDPVYKELTDFSARNRRTGCFLVGCHYFIDEVHGLYSSRNYQKVSPDAENYQSQLRKLDDDQTLISQHPEKVDKNFRRNATEWLQVQNMARTILFMGVTLNSRFRFHYFNQSEMPTKLDRPTSSGWYSFEKRKAFHQLYFTMDGVGISGGLVKESSRVRGRSPLVWVAALVLICIGAYLLPRLVQGVVRGAVKGTVAGFGNGVSQGLSGAMPTPAAPVRSVAAVTPAPSDNQGLPFVPVSPSSSSGPARPRREIRPVLPEGGDGLYCKGFAPVGTNVWIYLSDGRVARSERGEVQAWGQRYVKVFGLPQIPVKTD